MAKITKNTATADQDKIVMQLPAGKVSAELNGKECAKTAQGFACADGYVLKQGKTVSYAPSDGFKSLIFFQEVSGVKKTVGGVMIADETVVASEATEPTKRVFACP